jgi:uncharacterized membrane protein YgdD (TMEM256/DUF423 family)
MDRTFIIVGALVMFLAVALGAFGAHALEDYFSEKLDLKSSYETAVRYQMIHGLAIFIVAWLVSRWDSSLLSTAGWLFLAGIILFSGSLYIMSLTDQRWLGAVTPIGGLAFLAGWLLVAISAWRH